MNFRMIGQVIGRVLCIEAALMLLPMVAALAYGESPAPFLITIAVTGGIGLVMWRVRAKSGGCSCSRATSRTTSTPCLRRSRV